MWVPWHFLVLLGVLPSIISGLTVRDVCPTSYIACDPAGSSLRDVPVIGPDLGRLYLELLYTVKNAPPSRVGQAPDQTRGDDHKNMCCAEGSDCLLTQSFHIALCWDKFTTNFFLTDGSYGSLANGSYRTPDGDEANLISGEYKKASGERGNIYDLSPADKPDTSDLPIPTPFTSKGVGTAIAGSELGATSTGMVMSTSTTSAEIMSWSISSTQSSSASFSSLTSSSDSVSVYHPTTVFVTIATLTGATYGAPANTTTGGGPSVTGTGTSGASMITAFTSSPICPPINVGATQFMYYILPRILISVMITMAVA